MEQDPEVIVGQIKQKIGDMKDGWLMTKPPVRMSIQQACEEMALYWNCAPENARESLLKHGYASSPLRDWRVADRGYNEDQVW